MVTSDRRLRQAHGVIQLQGLFLSVLGMLWPRLTFSRKLSAICFGLAVYGCFAAWTANLLGAIWGAGNTIVPIAAGAARGSDLQEGIINLGLRTAAVALIATAVVVLWGLRKSADSSHAVHD